MSKVITCGNIAVRGKAWEDFNLIETEALGMYLTYKKIQKLLKEEQLSTLVTRSQSLSQLLRKDKDTKAVSGIMIIVQKCLRRFRVMMEFLPECKWRFLCLYYKDEIICSQDKDLNTCLNKIHAILKLNVELKKMVFIEEDNKSSDNREVKTEKKKTQVT